MPFTERERLGITKEYGVGNVVAKSDPDTKREIQKNIYFPLIGKRSFSDIARMLAFAAVLKPWAGALQVATSAKVLVPIEN